MNSIGERLLYCREEQNLTQDKLAKAVGLSRVAISNIELGLSSSVKAETLFSLSRVLKKRPEWLMYGKGLENLDDDPSTFSALTPTSSYPLISWNQATKLSQLSETELSDSPYYPCPETCSENTFLLEIQGDSMNDQFWEGDKIYVDPKKTSPDNGAYIVVKFEGSETAAFKQLQLLDNKKFLKVINSNYPPEVRYVAFTSDVTIIGTVIAHTRPVPCSA
ncbi:S24 family peptidase [Enterovibrio sp. Hal110]